MAFVAAKDIGCASEDLDFLLGELLLFLCDVGFAAPGRKATLRDGAAGAAGHTDMAVSARKGEGAIGGHVQGGQDGADGDIGAVAGMDEAVIFPEESQARPVSQPAIHQGRGIHQGEEFFLRIGGFHHFDEPREILVIDFVIVRRPGVESDISFLLFLWLIRK